MDGMISSEEARTMPLSLNPFRRRAQVREVMSSCGIRLVGINADFSHLGRSTLVRMAESHENSRATEIVRRLRELDNLSQQQQDVQQQQIVGQQSLDFSTQELAQETE